MKPLFSEEEFGKAKNKDKLLCECHNCNKPFLVEIRYVKDALKGKQCAMFCSQSCSSSYKGKNNKKECEKCHSIISKSNFKKHYDKCNGKKNIPIIDKYKNEEGKYICPKCNLEFKKYAIGKHVWVHNNEDKHKEWITKRNNMFLEGKWKPKNQHIVAKENGTRYIVKDSTKLKLKIAGTKRKHTEEQKQKIREQKIKLYQEQPEKIPFKMYKYWEKSYPEKIFEHGLTSNTITNYIYDYNFGMYYYDFAFPDLKIDIEIDGDFHKKPQIILKDNFRDEYSLKNGWTVIRFEARLVLKSLDYCIEQVKKIIENFDKYQGQKIKFWYKDYINEKATPT